MSELGVLLSQEKVLVAGHCVSKASLTCIISPKNIISIDTQLFENIFLCFGRSEVYSRTACQGLIII